MAIGNWIGEKTAKFFGHDRVAADILGTIEEERSIQSRVLTGFDDLIEKIEARNREIAKARGLLLSAAGLLRQVAGAVEARPEDSRDLPSSGHLRHIIAGIEDLTGVKGLN